MEMDSINLINEFRIDLAIKKLSKGTQQQYPQFVQNLSDFVNSDLLSVDEDTMTRYLVHLQERNIRKSSMVKYFNGISMFFNFLMLRKKLITANPATPIRNYYLRNYKDNAPGQLRQCPTIEQAKTLVRNILEPRDLAIVFLLLKTGVRLHELTELNLADINIPNRTIILHETTKRTNRTVFFDDETVYVLQKWLMRREKENIKQLDALLVNRFGDRLSNVAITRLVKKYAVVVGLHDPNSDRHELQVRLTPHHLRYAFTTWLLDAGMPPKYVQHLRGDVGREAIDGYYQPNKDLIKHEYLAKMPRLF